MFWNFSQPLNTYVSICLGYFTDRKYRQIFLPFYILQLLKSLLFQIYLKPEKNSAFGRSLPIQAIIETCKYAPQPPPTPSPGAFFEKKPRRLGKVRFLLWGVGRGILEFFWRKKSWPSHFLEWVNAWPFRNTQTKFVGNLRKSPGRYQKSRSWQGENLTHLTQKKLAGIILGCRS